jgi:hypothetical protein
MLVHIDVCMYFMAIWYIMGPWYIFYVLVCCTKKTLATLGVSLFEFFLVNTEPKSLVPILRGFLHLFLSHPVFQVSKAAKM